MTTVNVDRKALERLLDDSKEALHDAWSCGLLWERTNDQGVQQLEYDAYMVHPWENYDDKFHMIFRLLFDMNDGVVMFPYTDGPQKIVMRTIYPDEWWAPPSSITYKSDAQWLSDAQAERQRRLESGFYK